MKLYLLYYEDYDGVEIYGVFSTEEIALSTKKKYNSNADIYEIELNEIRLFENNFFDKSPSLLNHFSNINFWLQHGKVTKQIVE